MGYYTSYLKWLSPDDPERDEDYPDMSSGRVRFTDKHPNDEQTEIKITLSSNSLRTYLKMMNAISKNTLADDIFDRLGGRDKFHSFIHEELNTDIKSLNFYTGSGLDIFLPEEKRDPTEERKDNISTCSLSLDLIKKISEFLSAVEIEDILDYAPHNEGTLKNRFKNYLSLRRAITGKTGTLNGRPTYALGGILSATLEKMPYVIINQPVKAYKYGSRKFQEIMMNRLSKKTGLVSFDSILKIRKTFVESSSSIRLNGPESFAQALTNNLSMLN